MYVAGTVAAGRVRMPYRETSRMITMVVSWVYTVASVPDRIQSGTLGAGRLCTDFWLTHRTRWFLQDEDVFVADQVHRYALPAGFADLLELEERRPGNEPAVTDRGEQGGAPLEREEPGGDPGRNNRGRQVDELTVLAPGPRGDNGDTAGPQQGGHRGGCR